MEAKLKKELGTTTLKPAGRAGGGCISEGQTYHTDTGKVFVKINHKSEVFYYWSFLKNKETKKLLCHFVSSSWAAIQASVK